ncbi:class E sortase [Xylanimonas oleitrophica]|uniref:Class E sortase n=2 Tax=Xylanimonas oleitrophica TaxID=2607479 RepID=A0A2W5XT72_9MICO|nr:class E sortase [Xylanimonas oleitrophica]
MAVPAPRGYVPRHATPPAALRRSAAPARRNTPPRRARRGAPRESAGSIVIGVLGELLITAGVLLGLFVAWQLWWTDVVAVREQAQILESLEWTPPPVEAPQAPTEHREAPPQEPVPPVGDVFAQVYVPKWGSDYVAPIAEGVDKEKILDRIGVGHYPGTAMPGELGNFATAGHRTTYGKPYHLVHELQPGDPIVVRTQSTWYVYRVTEHQIVLPQQVEVISPVPGLKPGDPLPELTKRYMTMTACHPMYSARERYIVHAELDYWTPVSEGVPTQLTEAGVNVVGAGGGA